MAPEPATAVAAPTALPLMKLKEYAVVTEVC